MTPMCIEFSVGRINVYGIISLPYPRSVDPHKKSGAEEPFETDGTEIFELYRELSQFEEAKKALDLCTED